MNLNLKQTTIYALVASLTMPALVAKAATIPASIQSQQRAILERHREIEILLNTKAHVLTKEMVATAEGGLDGSVSGSAYGSFSANSPMAGLLKGVSLGVMGGVGLGAVAAVLGGPLGLATALGTGVLGGGAIGGGLGALAGSAEGAPVAEGRLNASLEGSVKGSYKSEAWINHYKPQIYVVTVINPDQLGMVKELSDRVERYNSQNKSHPLRSDFLSGYYKLSNSFYQSKRFFTPAEAQDLVGRVSAMNADLYDLKRATVGLTTEQQVAVNEFIKTVETATQQKLIFNKIGLNGFDVHLRTSDFINIYGERSFFGIKVVSGTSAEQLASWVATRMNEYLSLAKNNLIGTTTGIKQLGPNVTVRVTGQYPDYRVFVQDSEKSFELILRQSSPVDLQIGFFDSQAPRGVELVNLQRLSAQDVVVRMQVVDEVLMAAISVNDSKGWLPSKGVVVFNQTQK